MQGVGSALAAGVEFVGSLPRPKREIHERGLIVPPAAMPPQLPPSGRPARFGAASRAALPPARQFSLASGGGGAPEAAASSGRQRRADVRPPPVQSVGGATPRSVATRVPSTRSRVAMQRDWADPPDPRVMQRVLPPGFLPIVAAIPARSRIGLRLRGKEPALEEPDVL